MVLIACFIIFHLASLSPSSQLNYQSCVLLFLSIRGSHIDVVVVVLCCVVCLRY